MQHVQFHLPSTKDLKFIYENQLVTIIAQQHMTIYQELSIPYIDANAFMEASFYSFELVSMIHNASKANLGQPAVVLMVTKEMLKIGYKLGQNLEAIGHGSPILIELSDSKGGFNLGYKPTHKQLFRLLEEGRRGLLAQGCLFPLEPFKEVEDEESGLACIIWLYPEEFLVTKSYPLKMVQFLLSDQGYQAR